MSDYQMRVYNINAAFIWVVVAILIGYGANSGYDLPISVGVAGLVLFVFVDALTDWPTNDEPA